MVCNKFVIFTVSGFFFEFSIRNNFFGSSVRKVEISNVKGDITI